jgi:hypothetical protein
MGVIRVLGFLGVNPSFTHFGGIGPVYRSLVHIARFYGHTSLHLIYETYHYPYPIILSILSPIRGGAIIGVFMIQA